MNPSTNPETQKRWTFDDEVNFVTLGMNGLPYGTYPEELVREMNDDAIDLICEPVALSHYYTRSNEDQDNKLEKFYFSREDVIQGEFRGFEVVESDCHFPVGIRMNIDLVPGSSPGVYREEIVPLWDEKEQALRVPNFNYHRSKGSIWSKIISSKVKIRF